MHKIKISEIMVPLEEYATVSEKATLFEAAEALEQAQEKFGHDKYRHRAVLVLNDAGEVVGKISMWAALRGLEHHFRSMGDMETLGRWGITAKYVKSMATHYELWEKPLDGLCKKAFEIKVKDVMQRPRENEYVSRDDTLDEGINRLIKEHYQSLLVTEGKRIIGVLRLTDVFKEVHERMKECRKNLS